MASLGPWLRGGGGGGFGWRMPFSSDIWDPFDWGRGHQLQQKQQGGDDTSVLAQAHVDWQETHNAHIFRADLPGVRKEEVEVQVEDGNVLQINGERVKEQEDTNNNWHCVERRCGRFVRRFRLPENADVDNVKGSLDNGVLTVTVPKKETNQDEAQKNIRYIDIA